PAHQPTTDSRRDDDDLPYHDAAPDHRLFEHGRIGRRIHPLPQPRDGYPHQTSIPKARVNRTSPSIMSRMSDTPLRNIRVRSMPMPNAKPEYSSGSTPTARSTRGLTIPQPPHSTHWGPSRCSGNHTSNSADGSVNGK